MSGLISINSLTNTAFAGAGASAADDDGDASTARPDFRQQIGDVGILKKISKDDTVEKKMIRRKALTRVSSAL